MERIANFYGYDIFKPNKKECQQANTPYPMYIAVSTTLMSLQAKSI